MLGARGGLGLAGVAVVTGGANGIGAATARRILSDSDKTYCAIVDLQEGETANLLEEFGVSRVRRFAADVSKHGSVESACKQIATWQSPITMLVNSAGIQVKAPSFDFTPDQWSRVMAVHIDGSFFWSQAAGQLMVRHGGGTIVNLASVSMYFALPKRIAYACAKAAVGALTRTLAVEWAQYGIRVNAVAPGWINTPLAEQAITRDKYDRGAAENENALKRFGEPEEVAELISFLLSDRASFITGEIVTIDGGYRVLKGD